MLLQFVNDSVIDSSRVDLLISDFALCDRVNTQNRVCVLGESPGQRYDMFRLEPKIDSSEPDRRKNKRGGQHRKEGKGLVPLLRILCVALTMYSDVDEMRCSG